MIKKIEPNNKIFLSEEFQKDKYKYNIIFKNLTSPELELYSDEENYFICRGEKGLPSWIWTKDNLNIDILKEIEECIELYLTNSDKDRFTCKKELHDLLIKDKFKYLNDEYYEMGFLICHKTKLPKKCDGNIDVPTDKDKATLIKYWYDDCNEIKEDGPITMEQATKDIEYFFKTSNFYVWRVDDKIVCMACYNVVENQAKIGHVYTPLEERKKGYAANLIYTITNELLLKNYVPLLYTNYNYIPSNKAYKNAGYEDMGILINFSCDKNKGN